MRSLTRIVKFLAFGLLLLILSAGYRIFSLGKQNQAKDAGLLVKNADADAPAPGGCGGGEGCGDIGGSICDGCCTCALTTEETAEKKYGECS